MIEDDPAAIEKLCSILHIIQTKEKELKRAQYRTAYYRSIRSALQKGTDEYAEWRANPRKLEEQINICRLEALAIQSEVVKLKRQMRGQVAEALQKAKAILQFQNGVLEGISLNNYEGNVRLIPASLIEEYADRWEATVAMNTLLEEEDKK